MLWLQVGFLFNALWLLLVVLQALSVVQTHPAEMVVALGALHLRAAGTLLLDSDTTFEVGAELCAVSEEDGVECLLCSLVPVVEVILLSFGDNVKEV